ncbi:MAG: diphosphomevalonate decarboxylase [Microgenomates group bacterium]
MIKKIKVKSPANIAFIKYWGQRDKKLTLPYNDSFSMNLSHCYTLIDLIIEEEASIQELYIKNYQDKDFTKSTDESFLKVKNFLQTTEKFLNKKITFGFKIYSQNTFPKKAGIASSASFFSGLALAFSLALNKKLSKKQLSILARLSGSGSACRSVPDGFCWWRSGDDSLSSYAFSIAPPSFWDLNDLVLILSPQEKKVSSAHGHQNAETSPFFKFRLIDVDRRLKLIKKAFFKKDFTLFGQLIEEETLSMHFVMMTQKPPLYYWSGKTIEVLKKIIDLRKNGLEVYYTIDAGENIHLICQKKDRKKIYDYFIRQREVREIIINEPAIGVRAI